MPFSYSLPADQTMTTMTTTTEITTRIITGEEMGAMADITTMDIIMAMATDMGTVVNMEPADMEVDMGAVGTAVVVAENTEETIPIPL